jgi:pSer/pThr/pTyr-binding forkhead associated (FHA) protein
MAANPHFEIQGGANPQRFELGEAAGDVVIGRSSDCQWAIPSSGVSRKHARISRQGMDVTVEDLGSSNGTFVNGERLGAPRLLHHQDLVRLGSVEIRYLAPQPEPGADATIAVTPAAAPAPSPTPTTPISLPPVAPEPPPPSERSAGTASTTRSVAPPRAPAPPPPSTPAADIVRPPPAARSPAAPREPVPAPAWLAASDDGTEPTLVELVAIAAGSFLVVFALGALLLRFVF